MGNQNPSTSPRADPATIKSIKDCIFALHGNFGQGKSHGSFSGNAQMANTFVLWLTVPNFVQWNCGE
jgi:hypothetical protein